LLGIIFSKNLSKPPALSSAKFISLKFADVILKVNPALVNVGPTGTASKSSVFCACVLKHEIIQTITIVKK